MTDALGYLSIAEARARLRAGDLTSRALTEACLAAIASAAKLNAFSTVTEERALAMADAADAKRQAGEDAALLGIPLGIKDLFCTEGVSSQAASNILTGVDRRRAHLQPDRRRGSGGLDRAAHRNRR
ncbi:MAG: amidase family protein, partial [Pseudomonadota bacterium]